MHSWAARSLPLHLRLRLRLRPAGEVLLGRITLGVGDLEIALGRAIVRGALSREERQADALGLDLNGLLEGSELEV